MRCDAKKIIFAFIVNLTFGDPVDPLVVSITKETDFDSCLTQNVDLPFTKVVLKWNSEQIEPLYASKL